MQFIFQKKALIFSIIFLLFSSFLFLFVLISTNNNKKISEIAQAEWQEKATRKENIKLTTDLIKTIESERNLLESHFIRNSDVVPFLDTIEKLAKGVETEAEVDSVHTEDSTSSLIADVKVSGNFENIYKLILLLENSPYDLQFVLVNIKSIDKQDASTKNETPKWMANLKIRLKSFVNK